MNDSIQTVINPLVAAVLMTIGVLIFVTILKTLKQMPLFGGRSAIVVAVSVTILCVLGMGDFLPVPARLLDYQPMPSKDTPNHDMGFNIPFLLIPYAALGLSILVMLLLMSANRILHRFKRQRPGNAVDRHKPQEHNQKSMDHERRFKDRSRFES